MRRGPSTPRPDRLRVPRRGALATAAILLLVPVACASTGATDTGTPARSSPAGTVTSGAPAGPSSAPAAPAPGTASPSTLVATSTSSVPPQTPDLPASSSTAAVPATTQAPFPPTGSPPAGSAAWDAADDALHRCVSAAGIGGGALVVVRGDEVLHETSVGGVDRTTALPVASAAKWLTAATLLTLVDDGTIALDEPIARWLPRFAPTMTLRHLLSHTAGIPEDDCLWDPHDTLAACVDRLATLPPRFAPGAAFAYGNSSFHVAGRLAEVASGRSFQALFADRIAGPLGLTHTTFGGGANPSPAAGAITSADDYLRFMRMVASGGAGTLSASSVAELRRDQTAGHDTSRDDAVGITRIPTYGFGLWRDKVVAGDRAVIISGNGGRGFYPWIDDETSTLGVLAVDDDRGAELAVPASRAVVDLAIAAVPRP